MPCKAFCQNRLDQLALAPASHLRGAAEDFLRPQIAVEINFEELHLAGFLVHAELEPPIVEGAIFFPATACEFADALDSGGDAVSVIGVLDPPTGRGVVWFHDIALGFGQALGRDGSAFAKHFPRRGWNSAMAPVNGAEPCGSNCRCRKS